MKTQETAVHRVDTVIDQDVCLSPSAKEETNLILCRQAIRGVHFRQVQYTKQ